MNAPPISDATFMVEEACNAMVDPERGVLAGGSGVAELICATDNAADSAETNRSANRSAENDLIAHLASKKS